MAEGFATTSCFCCAGFACCCAGFSFVVIGCGAFAIPCSAVLASFFAILESSIFLSSSILLVFLGACSCTAAFHIGVDLVSGFAGAMVLVSGFSAAGFANEGCVCIACCTCAVGCACAAMVGFCRFCAGGLSFTGTTIGRSFDTMLSCAGLPAPASLDCAGAFPNPLNANLPCFAGCTDAACTALLPSP